MPVIVKFTCPKCRGETDTEGVRCIACSMHDLIKSQGGKYFPSQEKKIKIVVYFNYYIINCSVGNNQFSY
jgi:hypothetical protein